MVDFPHTIYINQSVRVIHPSCLRCIVKFWSFSFRTWRNLFLIDNLAVFFIHVTVSFCVTHCHPLIFPGFYIKYRPIIRLSICQRHIHFHYFFIFYIPLQFHRISIFSYRNPHIFIFRKNSFFHCTFSPFYYHFKYFINEFPMVPSGIFTPKLSATVAPTTAKVSVSGSFPPPVIDFEYNKRGTFSLV